MLRVRHLVDLSSTFYGRDGDKKKQQGQIQLEQLLSVFLQYQHRNAVVAENLDRDLVILSRSPTTVPPLYLATLAGSFTCSQVLQTVELPRRQALFAPYPFDEKAVRLRDNIPSTPLMPYFSWLHANGKQATSLVSN